MGQQKVIILINIIEPPPSSYDRNYRKWKCWPVYISPNWISRRQVPRDINPVGHENSNIEISHFLTFLRTYGMVGILWWYNYNRPIFKALEHKTNKILKWNVVIHVYHVHVTTTTIPYVLNDWKVAENFQNNFCKLDTLTHSHNPLTFDVCCRYKSKTPVVPLNL